MDRLEESMRDVADGYERLIAKIEDLSGKIERKVKSEMVSAVERAVAGTARETASLKSRIPDCKYYDIAKHVAVETR
jgi:hypothetical protein